MPGHREDVVERARSNWRVVLSIIAIASVICAGALSITAYKTQDSITQRMDKIAAVAQLLSNLKDAETGERGYLLTQQPQYLEPYDAAVKRLPDQYATVRGLFASDLDQVPKIRELINISQIKVDGLQTGVRIARERGFGAAALSMKNGIGKERMDRARAITAEVIQTERKKQNVELERLAAWQIGFYVAIAILLVVISGILVSALIQSLRQTAVVTKEAEGKSLLLQEILEYSPDLIFVKDRDGKYSHANKATLSVMKRKTATGLKDADIYPEDIAKKIVQDDNAAMQIPLASTYEETLPADQVGTRQFYLTTKVAIRNSFGEIIGLLGISKNITERKEAEDRQRLMINELNHRVKNTLSVLHSVALQSFKGANPAQMETFEGRLRSMSFAHDILTRQSWSGAKLGDIVDSALSPFCSDNSARCIRSGPAVDLSPSAALAISMVLHELGTNAAKYGALSDENGHVDIDWSVLNGDDSRLRIIWRELDGPPIGAPGRIGFGTKLIQRSFAFDPDSKVSIEYPVTGLVCQITLCKFAPKPEILNV